MRGHDDAGPLCADAAAPEDTAPIPWALSNAPGHLRAEVISAFHATVGLRMHYMRIGYQSAALAEYSDAEQHVQTLRRGAALAGEPMTADGTCDVLLKHFERRQEALHTGFLV